MRSFRRFCLVITLVFTLSFSAYAGEIECPGIIQDPTQPTVAGDIQNGAEATDTIEQTMLSLIVTLLSLP